jgi:polyferredoxin
VQVCPTGIDIRHGLQLECVGCAACIDACDGIMAKVHRPPGLIRYDSFTGFAGGKTRWLRPRTVVYGILLLIGVSVATFAFSTVKPASFMVMRMSSAAYFVTADEVRNQFMVRLLNKRSEPSVFTLSLGGLPEGTAQNGFASTVTVGALGEQVSPLILRLDRRRYTGPFKFTISVQDQSRTFTLARQIEFLGPDARLLQEEDHEKGITR